MERLATGATGQVVATAVAALLLSTAAQAQIPSARPAPNAAQPPTWDAGGSTGLFFMHQSEVAAQHSNAWNGNAEVRADLGHYWTPHLKAGLAVGTAPRFRSYEEGFVIVGGVRRSAGVEVATRLTTVAPSLTYQFLDNGFMHPYVTGGVRIGLLNVHRTRHSSLYSDRGQTVDVPSIDERRMALNARPFAAAGVKSYLNRQTFVRTEALTAFGPSGAAQVTLHLGIGVDF
jgi:hypothetical protein